MKIKQISFAAIFSFVIAFAIFANDNEFEKEKQAIKNVIERQNEGWLTKSFEIEAEVWAHEPYIVKVSQNGEQIIGWEAISARYKRKFAGGCSYPAESKYSYDNFHFQIYDNVAWVTHEQVLTAPGNPDPQIVSGWESRILEKRDGKWKIVYHASRFPH